jgi:hypothetical protein
MKTKSSTPPHKKPWYLLTGFFLGIVLGLIISWWVFPVEYVDTPPSSLREDLKDEYRVMIALSYAINRDLERAKLRLQLLDGEETVTQTTLLPTSAYQLAIQAQKALAEGRVETEAQALGLLAAALGQKPSPYPSPTTQPSPSKTYTPAITSFPTTLHTITATTTFTGLYQLQDRFLIRIHLSRLQEPLKPLFHYFPLGPQHQQCLLCFHCNRGN